MFFASHYFALYVAYWTPLLRMKKEIGGDTEGMLTLIEEVKAFHRAFHAQRMRHKLVSPHSPEEPISSPQLFSPPFSSPLPSSALLSCPLLLFPLLSSLCSPILRSYLNSSSDPSDLLFPSQLCSATPCPS